MEKKKRERPLRILFLGASASMGTGYGLVIRNLAQRLNKREDMQCYQLGLQTFGEIDNRYGFDIFSIGDDPCGNDRLEDCINLFGIDILITFVDIWLNNFHYIKDVVNRTGISWVCHLTVNALPISPYLVTQAIHADEIVTPAKFGETEARKGGLRNVTTILHGIDTDVFKKYSDDEISNIKEDMRVKDKFVFLSVGRNQMMQKNYPALLYAYKIFLENEPSAKENTILHIHANPAEHGGYDMKNLANRYGITHNVYYTVGHRSNVTLPPSQMAELYNYADCHVTTSHGESVSLPTLEMMSCGNPSICPNFSAMTEWIEESGAGRLAKIKALWTTALLEDQCLVDEIDLAKQMMEIYNDKKLCKEMGKKGSKYIRSKFLWDRHIIPQWVKLIKKFDMEDYDNKPLVSVMVLSHNRKQWLGQALDSVLAQTYKNIEVIIVDNGSTDGSIEIIDAFAKRDNRIKAIKNKENLGCPKARNQALVAMKGKYLIFNDDDDVSFPRRAEKCVKYMEDNPDVAAMCGNSQIIDENGAIHDSNQFNAEMQITFDALVREHCVNSPTACVRIDNLREIGGFDDSLKIASDRDIWLGLSAKYKLMYTDMQLMQYRIHTKNTSIMDPKETQEYVKKIIEKRVKERDEQK